MGSSPPDEHEIKNNKTSLLFGTEKSLPILATRGCPYSCFKYCVYPLQQGRKPRQRDPKLIVDELEYWSKNFNMHFGYAAKKWDCLKICLFLLAMFE